MEIKPSHALDVDFIKSNYQKIHYFGLGFIQVKFNEFYRAHYYTNKFPKTTQIDEIHNHRYDFFSEILKGKLKQKLYHIQYDEDGDFFETQETCTADKINFPKNKCDAMLIAEEEFTKGNHYYLKHNDFHTVEANNTITLLRRFPKVKEYANVVYHKEKQLTCPFSHKISNDELFETIKEIIEHD